MCVHKTPCQSLFISFVSFSFNSPHVSVSTRTSIRASEIRVLKNIRVIRIITSLRSVGLRRISCSKSRVPHVSATPRTKIREIGEIRMPIKIFVLSALFVFKRKIPCSQEIYPCSHPCAKIIKIH